MTDSQLSIEDPTFIQVSDSWDTVSRKFFQRRKTSLHRFLNLGINLSLVDSAVDCRAHKVTLTTQNRIVSGYKIRNVRVSIAMENDWPSYEELRSVIVHFPTKFCVKAQYNIQ